MILQLYSKEEKEPKKPIYEISKLMVSDIVERILAVDEASVDEPKQVYKNSPSFRFRD